MESEEPFLHIPWDARSEQPKAIRTQRSLAQRLKHAWLDYLKAGLTFLCFFPLAGMLHVAMSRGRVVSGWRQRGDDPVEFMGLAVALHSCEPERLAIEIRKLGVKHLLLRVPVWEIELLDKYVKFMDSLPDQEFVVCILQDRPHVRDREMWRRSLRAVVDACWPRVRTFQIGHGPNRTKWGFFSGSEYLAFAAEAQNLRASHPGIELIGPGILDFEPIPLLRGLVHGYPVRWDAVACGLYVDRRGSPRNRQLLVFDFKNKIRWFAACIACSRKARRRFWITEVNWPIKNQGAYSPVREIECVSEEDAGRYLREYYEDAWDAKLVERVYWWQLVAKGFGLMDIREDGTLRERPAYHEFKDLLNGGLKKGGAEPPAA